MSGVYVYAVLASRPASDCGLGICAEHLRVVVAGDLVAVVGDVAERPDVSALMLRAQDAVCRRLAAVVDAVLPARFGTLVGDDAAVSESLAQRRAELSRALGRVAGCEQMTLRVWGESAAPTVVADPAAAGPGARYLAERRAAHQQARSVPELQPLRAELARLVRDERVERQDRPPLLATVHHLVRRGAGPQYLAVVDGARERVRPWRLSVTGPWLAYAFAEDAA